MTKRLSRKAAVLAVSWVAPPTRYVPACFGQLSRAVDDLVLFWNVMRERRETPCQPVVRVESAHRPEMLLHPRQGLVAYCQRLFYDHSDKRAQRPNDQNKKNQKSYPGRERPASAEQSRDPPVERIAQPGEQRAEEQRNQERPRHREEGKGHCQDENEDERCSKGRPAHVGVLHGRQYDPVVAQGSTYCATDSVVLLVRKLSA